MRSVLAITKALADPNRLRVLHALRREELCVCQVIELLGLAPSTVSKHLSILYQAGLIDARKEGRWMHYRLPPPGQAAPRVDAALRWVGESLAGDPQVLADAKRLKAIVAIAPEVLCHGQMKRPKSCFSARGTRVAARSQKAGRGI